MKRYTTALLALLVCGAALGAQDTSIDEREVRNPKTLKVWLEANAADAEARLAAGGSVADTLALLNANDAGTASVTLQADRADDAGDKYGLVATDGSGLDIQSDIGAKGTLSTVASVENTGLITTLVGIDGIGAVDFDIGSADITDVTVTTDGGTVILDGSVTASDDLVATDDCTVGDDLTVTGAAAITETLAVTGAVTLSDALAVTGAATLSSTLDVDSITVDAGAGVDNQAARTLVLGASTATKVEIADTGVETEVQGTLDVHEGLDVNEDVTVDLDAADEELTITQAAVAGTAGVPLITISDARTGATADTYDEASIEIIAAGVYGLSITDGALYVEGVSTLVGAITGTGDITVNGGDATVNNSANAGAATLTFTADKADDAADYVKLSVADGGTLSIYGTSGTNQIATLTQAGNLALDGTGTFGGAVAATEATIDGKYAAVGGNATTGLMVLSKAITATAVATQTNVFDTAFGAAPLVAATYTEDPGDVRPIYITSVTPSNMVVNVTGR